jgi:hypothetical protein
VKNIEIPYQEDKTKTYLFFEKLPAIMTYSLLSLPIVLSLISPWLTAMFILGYIFIWFLRAVALNVRVLQGWKMMKAHRNADWKTLLADVENQSLTNNTPKWHQKNIARLEEYPPSYKPSEIFHVFMIACYNESKDIIEPTVRSVLDSNYDLSQVALVIAYEERGGPDIKRTVTELICEYGDKFAFAEAVEHPADIPREIIGKGGNITFAGRVLKKRLDKLGMDPNKVLVTTLDSDNRPHPNYLAGLTYTYCLTQEPKYISYQPIPMFTNNIWDAPAPMRVIATGNSFWMVIQSLRPHILRNFSAHAQSMAALIDTDFWSVRTIVEDGHQYWRTYFRYDGNHDVYPIYLPIYQDAVLAEGYRRTFKAQFIQLRRWAWGCSDIAYVATKGFFTKNNIPKWRVTLKLARLMEGHLSWATAPPLLLFSAFIPILFNPDDIAANQLPNLVSTIQRVAMIGILITLFLSFKALPPKPDRYKKHRNIFMALQWVILPLTGLLYNSASALYSQTRLFLGKYLDKFDVTEKAVKK